MKVIPGKIMKILNMMLLILSLASLSYTADEKKWMIEANFGKTALHDTNFNGTYFCIQVSHSLKPDNSFMLDFGFVMGYTRILYGGLFVGLKYRFFSDKIFSPFIHGAIGRINEEDRTNTWVMTASAGIDINITPRVVIPVTCQYGIHRSISKGKGPYAISVGIGYRF